MSIARFPVKALALGAVLLASCCGIASAAAPSKDASGLPVPRFVSLKSNHVNIRKGPGQDYPIAFIFVRAGLPVEIVQEFGNWRKIRDSEGDEGWVLHSLLSGRRTALVTPWQKDGTMALHRTASDADQVVAYLEPSVMTVVDKCSGSWCLVDGTGFRGWIEQERLWGVYPQEKVDE
ncbi:SH3-like domain-containing protein [Faunimonas pinastri]|uniref:SH3-like domain-containing protein n=1 Tax=Faunimonas pinastri TaxID=1855383 RepID=A0A1H9GMT0_9HYPH|nr:SH3 domain-containing protein [Faunimonas pinastri]SEQ51395.1 SH3-like domain-containing protein [Faunimonas pinastri]